jgi:hypothetical protein
MLKRGVIAAISFSAVCLAFHPAAARDWVVNDTGIGGDAPTIQAAIDSAADGDNVILNDGTFRGAGNRNIDFKGKAIIVTSANNSSSTIIDCETQDRAFRFVSGEENDSVLRNVTIRNGFNIGDGGAILVGDSSPTITGCHIVDCQARSGGGIYVWVGQVKAAPVIQLNSITGCRATNDGGGINVGESNPIIEQNVISQCSATNGGGIFVWGFPAGPEITTNLIHGNTATANGGGLCAMGVSGGGLMGFRGNLVYDNHAANGGGLYFEQSVTTFIYNTVAENTASTRGSGLYVDNGTNLALYLSIFAFNMESEAIYCSDTSPSIDCCLVWNPGFDGAFDCQSRLLVTEDPKFCGELSSFNYYLQTDSPALDVTGCAQRIGALGVNCGSAPATDATWGSIKAMYD